MISAAWKRDPVGNVLMPSTLMLPYVINNSAPLIIIIIIAEYSAKINGVDALVTKVYAINNLQTPKAADNVISSLSGIVWL